MYAITRVSLNMKNARKTCNKLLDGVLGTDCTVWLVKFGMLPKLLISTREPYWYNILKPCDNAE